MKMIYKWIPYDIWEQVEYEAWLKELAASGLSIQSGGNYWARFKKSKPSVREYRISFDTKQAEQEDLTDCEWEEVYSTCNFSLYESEKAKSMDRLYKDEKRQVEILKASYKGSQTQILWRILLCLFIIGVLFRPRDYYILSLVNQDYNVLGIIALSHMVIVFREIRNYIGLKRLEKVIQEGRTLHPVQERKLHISKWIYIALLGCLGIILFIQMKTIDTRNERIKLPIEEVQLPIVQLSELEKNPTLRRNPSDGGYGFYNYYEKHWTPVAFRVYESSESGIVETLEDGEGHPYIKTKYYEVLFKGIGDRLVKELIQKHAGWLREIDREEAEGLGGVYVLSVNGRIELIGVKDNRVMYVKYEGNATLEELVKEMARKIVY